MLNGTSRFTIRSFPVSGTLRKKHRPPDNVKAYTTYGTRRINAYKIIEETLNLKDVRIFDYVEDVRMVRKKAVLNAKDRYRTGEAGADQAGAFRIGFGKMPTEESRSARFTTRSSTPQDPESMTEAISFSPV